MVNLMKPDQEYYDIKFKYTSISSVVFMQQQVYLITFLA